MRRGAGAKFMPNAVVFPGGVAADPDKLLGPPSKIAALRELFEETGLILGQKDSAATSPELHELQKRTKVDANNFKLVSPFPPVDELIEWNTWLTPAGYKQRYMTSFFLAGCDGEPDIRMCEEEMSHYIWIDPKECLEKASNGEFILPPPQVYELTRISQIPIEKVRKYGNTTHVLCPQLVEWPDGSHISGLLPGDHLYIGKTDFRSLHIIVELIRCFRGGQVSSITSQIIIGHRTSRHRQAHSSYRIPQESAICRM
uniref:Nudix hydrolase domain-containing protein n=1 Tax=Angiostrongylus cantonensis TaxID=6313 RepID=A0A0K0DJB2_ANGCA